MGRKARLPIDLVLPTPGYRFTNEVEFISETMAQFHLMYKYIRKKEDGGIQRTATQYTGVTTHYQIDDLVWVYTKRRIPGKPLKLTSAWVGPYKVIEIPSQILVKVKPANTAGKTITKHVTCLRRYRGTEGNVQNKVRVEVDNDGDDLAEEIGTADRDLAPEWELGVPVHTVTTAPTMADIERPAPVPPSPQQQMTPEKQQVVPEVTPAPPAKSNAELRNERANRRAEPGRGRRGTIRPHGGPHN